MMNCPHCHRLLYSRQQPRCGFCGKPLPEDLRLAPHEIDEIKAEIREIDARRAKAKEKEEEEREAIRRRNDGAGGGGGPGMGFG
jgi:predicted  nucleic acid-binding Zn-ribbon protein